MKRLFLTLIFFSIFLVMFLTPVMASGFSFFDTFPGKTIDINKWNVSDNGGVVKIEKGYLVLDNSESVSPYPFIDSKIDPFVSNEFELETKFRFEGSPGNPYGIAFAVTPDEQPQNQSFGNSPYSNNRNFWMNLQGDFRFGFGTTTIATKPYDNEWHTLVFKKVDGSSQIYFDGELLGTSTLNWAKSTNIWFGLTNSMGFGPNQYPALHIRDIRVK